MTDIGDPAPLMFRVSNACEKVLHGGWGKTQSGLVPALSTRAREPPASICQYSKEEARTFDIQIAAAEERRENRSLRGARGVMSPDMTTPISAMVLAM
jgi:hypothetical protein